MTSEANAVQGFAASSMPLAALNLVLTIPVSAADASVQIERILRLLVAVVPQCSAQFHLLPTMPTVLPPSSQTVQPTESTAAIQTNATSASGVQDSGGNIKTPQTIPESAEHGHGRSHREPSTEKQQQLLQRLAIRKRLSADIIKQILIQKFGVESGAQLSKKQASELISSWM